MTQIAVAPPSPRDNFKTFLPVMHPDDSRIFERHQPSLSRATVVKLMWAYKSRPKLLVVLD